MIDIHCHPLPGVDDGAASLEVAVMMCQMAAADGITDLVATPHSNYAYTFDPQRNRQLLSDLQEKVGARPRLLLGCDLHLSYDNIQQCLEDAQDFTINRTSYMLVELPDQFIPEHLSRVYYELQAAGITPIITHPERNLLLQRRPELIKEWAAHGCLVQVTAQSYLGGFGSVPRKFSERLLEAGLVHFFATDAHDVKYRPPILSHCYEKLARRKGEEIADLLTRGNADAVIQGRPLPPQPKWIESAVVQGKRGWLSFWRHW